MEGKYTKIGTIIGCLGLIITIWQLWPKTEINLAGKWKMVTEVDASDYNPYIGKRIEWKMFINENQNSIKGTAEKYRIDDVEVNSKNKTCLELEGTINGNAVILSYSENGRLRKTTGMIQAVISNGKLSGTFSQTAANSTGKISAEKIP